MCGNIQTLPLNNNPTLKCSLTYIQDNDVDRIKIEIHLNTVCDKKSNQAF